MLAGKDWEDFQSCLIIFLEMQKVPKNVVWPWLWSNKELRKHHEKQFFALLQNIFF
jgi:hypothetical protein